MMQFKYATLSDLELLIQIRINDLLMFSDKQIEQEVIENIRNFYKTKLETNELITLLGFDNDKLVAHATIYQYLIMPSHENKQGKVGQITNVYVDNNYRRLGYASKMIKQLIDHVKDDVGLICLNSSLQTLPMYQKLGFKTKDNYLVYRRE